MTFREIQPLETSHQTKITIRHLHISHNAPHLSSRILHNLCYSFLLGITAVLRETENNIYAKLGGGGQIWCIMGDVQVAIAFKSSKTKQGI